MLDIFKDTFVYVYVTHDAYRVLNVYQMLLYNFITNICHFYIIFIAALCQNVVCVLISDLLYMYLSLFTCLGSIIMCFRFLFNIFAIFICFTSYGFLCVMCVCCLLCCYVVMFINTALYVSIFL